MAEDMIVYDFFRDQGSLIAGFLALIAGVFAYQAGREQAHAVREQNAELKRIEQQRFAHSRLVAIRLLDGVLEGIDECLNIEITYVGRGADASKGDGQRLGSTAAAASRRRIKKPELEIVWEQLGYLDPDWIKNYMSLDREIFKLWATEDMCDPGINSMLNEFRKLRSVVGRLRSDLNDVARREKDVPAAH